MKNPPLWATISSAPYPTTVCSGVNINYLASTYGKYTFLLTSSSWSIGLASRECLMTTTSKSTRIQRRSTSTEIWITPLSVRTNICWRLERSLIVSRIDITKSRSTWSDTRPMSVMPLFRDGLTDSACWRGRYDSKKWSRSSMKLRSRTMSLPTTRSYLVGDDGDITRSTARTKGR